MESSDDLDYLLPANGPNPYYDTWDRHNSIAFSTATKGLHNAPGENNCFVNSAVQVFWHLDVFRRSYRRLSGHTCMGNSCIFCALKVIFTQFQFSDQSSLHPDALRKALAETFANQQRFQLGHMDDAAECFENILKRIHFHIAHNHPEDTCTAPHCLPHQKFSLSIVEKVMCPCGASSKPLQYREMVHYISVSALVSQAQLMQESGDVLHPDRFGLLLRNANALGDMRQCPGGCGKTVQIRRTLLNTPDVVSIGLGWDSDHPSMEMTTKVARSIGTAILLQDVFHSVMQDLRNLPRLQLVGLVCYYGKHYSTFVFHSKLEVWIYFDDTTVKEIGPSFEHVVEKCSRGRYQPLLLLYANPNSSPVPVETAPKKRVMAPGYYLPGSEDENSLDRTHESISSQHSVQRAMTPNPEPSTQLVNPSLPRARSVTPSSHDISRKEASSPSLCGSDHSRQQSFITAMSTTKTDLKGRPPLRMGGQAGAGNIPGPMTPVAEQEGTKVGHQQSAFHRPSQDQNNYADYTLSNSDQYRRPSLTGFTPADLPLTPNQKGHGDSPRKESFKRNKEPLHADVIRYHMDSNKEQTGYPYQEGTNNQHNVRSSAMFYQGPGSNSQFRQRSLSQGGDEAYASDSSEYSRGPSQHTIVKPTASGQAGDSDDKRNSYTHTAVQSGLATLPRRKKSQPEDNSSSQNFRPVSIPHAQYYPKEEISRHTPVMDPAGLPPLAPGRVISPVVPLVDQVDSSGKKSGSDIEKKMKKAKKELKKTEKKKMKSYPNCSAVEAALISRQAEEEAAKTNEVDVNEEHYINRKMVASVLKHQGLQRQPSTHSTNSQTSSSSLESEGIMGKLLAAKSHGDASFDNVSLGSHKDSGYGSSDRNSSSSTGSGTIDPSVQYFLSKSMVVPRNFNSQIFERQSQQFVTDFTAPTPHVYPSQHVGQGEGADLGTPGQFNAEEKNRIGYQRKIMHPIKESSQEDMLKIMPKELIEATAKRSTPNPDTLISKEGRPPPIPPKNFAAFQVSKSAHQREPSIDSLDKDEVKNDYFVSMCEKADDLMDRCILAETQENLSDALRYCDSALGCLKEAMNQTDIEKKAAVYAQKKHKSCLLKSRSLFKRVSSQNGPDGHVGKRSSITSTDSDSSDKLMRRAPSKERLMASNRTTPVPHQQRDVCNSSIDSTSSARQSPKPGSQTQDGMHVKVDLSNHGLRYDCDPHRTVMQAKDAGEKGLKSQSSRSQMVDNRSDSGSNHSRSGSNSSVRSSVSVPCSLSQQAPPPSMPKSHSSIGTAAGPVPLDAYCTLSRNRKPRRTSDPTGNSEVYQMFLSKQKHLQSDNSSTDSRESDSSGSDGNPQRKTSKAEIRELLGNNIVQLQKHQLSSQVIGTDVGNVPKSRHSYEGSTPAQLAKAQPVIGVQTQQSSGRTSNRHSTVGYPSQSRNSPVLVSHEQSTVKPPVSSSAQSRIITSNLSHQPPPSHPHQAPVKQHVNVGYHHERSHSQQHLLDNNNVHQKPHPSKPSPQQHHHLHQTTHQPPPSSSQPPQTVSGYSQPLPGHRVPPSNMRQNNINSHLSPNPSPVASQHGRPSSLYSQSSHSQSPSHCYSPNPQHPSYPVSSSSSVNSSQHFTMSSNPSNTTQAPHNSSVQGSNSSIQNLNSSRSQPVPQDVRRPGGVQPPPPPARTTSNPDFRVQLIQRPSASQNVSSQKYNPQPQQQQNIVRVQPNSHLLHTVTPDSYNAQDQASSRSHHYRPGSSTDATIKNAFGSSPGIQGSQMKHAYSSTGLNTIASMAPRPMERCTSQPDLPDMDPYSSDGSSFPPPPPSHPVGHIPNTNTAVHLESGPNLRLVQTSNHTSSVPKNGNPEMCERQQSVKDLMSRFDQQSVKPAVKPKPNVSRNRSKSESGSKKPKSVLKNKKAKSGGKSRKNVTFAQDFSAMASGYESAAELTSFSSTAPMNDRAYFSDDEEHLGSRTSSTYYNGGNDPEDVEDSNSDDTPPPEELACQMCHKREMEPGRAYCFNCYHYMNRLTS